MNFTLKNSTESKKNKYLLLTLYENLGTPVRSSLRCCLDIICLPTPESMVSFSFLPSHLLITDAFTLETFRRFIFFLYKAELVTQNTAISRAIP